MNVSFLRKEFKANCWKIYLILAFLIISAVLLVLRFPRFPPLLEQQDLVRLGVENQEKLEIYEFALYLANHWINRLFYAGSILAVLLGVDALAREIEEGTLTFLLSTPQSRQRIFFGKTLINLSLLGLVIIISTLWLGGVVILQNYDIYFLRFLLLGFWFFIFAALPYSLGLLLSFFISDRVKAGIIAVAIFFLFNFLTPGSLAWISEYYLSAYFPAIEGSLPYLKIAVILAAAALMQLLSWRFFSKREF